jgi:hypothetical protein
MSFDLSLTLGRPLYAICLILLWIIFTTKMVECSKKVHSDVLTIT